MMKKNSIFLLSFLLLSLLLLSACGHEAVSITSSSDYAMAGDLQAMYDKAVYVAIGQFGEFQESWNMSRDIDDPSKEAADRYSEGHIYEFPVESILKNETQDLRDVIWVSPPYSQSESGEIPVVSALPQKEDEMQSYSFTKIRDFYIAPEEDVTYLVFFSHADGIFDLYYPTAEPYRIRLNEESIATLESNLLLPDAEKEQLSIYRGEANGGEPFIFQSTGLSNELEDSISGHSLEELLLKLGFEPGYQGEIPAMSVSLKNPNRLAE